MAAADACPGFPTIVIDLSREPPSPLASDCIDMGVSGGSGGSGGKRHDGRKRNSVPELFKDRERKRNKFRLMSPQDKIAWLGALRDQYGRDMCAQVDTHMLIELIFGVDLQAEALLEERKVEIENFIDAMHGASVLAGDQGKVLSVRSSLPSLAAHQSTKSVAVRNGAGYSLNSE